MKLWDLRKYQVVDVCVVLSVLPVLLWQLIVAHADVLYGLAGSDRLGLAARACCGRLRPACGRVERHGAVQADQSISEASDRRLRHQLRQVCAV